MAFTFLSRSLRQILPRKEIRERDRRSGAYPVKSKTGDNFRTGRNNLYFDDQRTILFRSGVNITYPTTLQFDSRKVATDLTSSLGNIVGNVDRYAVDQFIPHRDQSERPGPFFDGGLFEQNETNLVNSKFMTGAAYLIAPDRFKSKISNKTILRMEFPLTRVSQMSTGSQIMYFSPTSGCFVSKVLERSFINNGQGVGAFTFAPIPFTPYGMAYMPLNDYNLNGSFTSTAPITPLPAERCVQRMVTYASDGSDNTFFNVSSGYTLGYVTSSILNTVHTASNEQTVSLQNTLGHPFLIEKIVVEFPFQAGPGWLNDNFRLREALNSDLQFAADGGGPMITFAIMRQDGADFNFRDIIASGTITTAMDMRTGSYTICTGTYAGGGGYSDITITPDGVAQLGIVPNVVVTGSFLSSSNNFYSGTIRMIMEPQITSHVLRGNVSGSSYFFVTSLIEDPTTPGVPTKAYGMSFGSIARRSAKYIESGRSVLGNDFALLDPKKLDQINNPINVMDSQYENLAQKASAPRISRNKMYMDIKSNTIKSPYLLYPQDKLVFCLSKHRAVADDTSILSLAVGTSTNPANLYANHDAAIGTGSIKITMYGDLIRQDIEFHDTLNQRLETRELWQDVGEDPVIDQFDVVYRNELSGTYIDRFNVLNAAPYLRTALTASQEVTQYYSNFSENRKNTDVISTGKLWTQAYKINELRKNFRGITLINTSEVFWDTRLPNPIEMIAIEQPQTDPNFGIDDGTTSTQLYTGNGTTQTGIADRTYKIGSFLMSYPYENKFKNVSSRFELGKDRLFSLNINYSTFMLEVGSLTGSATNSSFRVVNVGDTDASSAGLHNVLPKVEFVKYFYGFGDGNGTYDNQHVRGKTTGIAGFFNRAVLGGADIRGWRYGMLNGFKTNSTLMYRRDRYGHPRDMLEQRLDTKYYDELGLTPDGILNGIIGVKKGPVQVSFYDAGGNQTNPISTLSSNLSQEATSSFPYVDGVARNRSDYDPSLLNISNIVI